MGAVVSCWVVMAGLKGFTRTEGTRTLIDCAFGLTRAEETQGSDFGCGICVYGAM